MKKMTLFEKQRIGVKIIVSLCHANVLFNSAFTHNMFYKLPQWNQRCHCVFNALPDYYSETLVYLIVLEFFKINLIDVYNIMMCQTETVGVAYVLPLEFSYVNVMINIFIVAVK